MSIEGLDFILRKEEVVPTVSARDLRDYPERVETNYKRHVRTYVPMSRVAEGREDGMTVDEFERKVLKAVKDARAPRGYLTAEYGYGKTSTALYLWQRAEDANLIAVPPFQLLELSDFLTAVYGWVRYRITERAPGLISELDALHTEVTGRSLEREAQEKNVSEAVLREYLAQGRFILEIQPSDYVRFFEQVTDIARRAGYDGILVLPDEVQQYIEPRQKREADPITPLFNLVQQVATRTGYLCFGIIFVIPLKEVGVIREVRDDLLHRLRDFSLDLTTVYGADFAANLWDLLAKEFDYEDVSEYLLARDTLDSLGEIAARQELSNGPRTVINAFRRIVERYRSLREPQPYSPIDLIDDFLGGAIPFAGNDQIPNVTRRALQHQIVHMDPERYEPAIKLAAAFPTNGVPFRLQQQYCVDAALEELRMHALGELVIGAGDEHHRGVTLFGLHMGVQQSDWLSQTIRDFRRAYGEQHVTTKERAVTVFAHLLKDHVFKGWRRIREQAPNMAANHSLVFEGHFPQLAGRYPNRRIHVRIMWEDEERKDGTIDGDMAVEYYLTLRADLRNNPDERRAAAQETVIDFDHNMVCVPVNLMYIRPEGLPLNLKQQLQGVWSPYDLSPLVLMNLYALMEEKRVAGLIPQSADQMISSLFQPELLDAVSRNLFNAEIGASLGGVSGPRITEEAISRILNNRYPDYKTIMGQSHWQNAIGKDYATALGKLENIYQKRGEVEVEGTKEQIAELLVRSATALDSFRRQYPAFLSVAKDWSGKDSIGAVNFTLHPLETLIVEWLQSSTHKERVQVLSSKVEVHLLDTALVYQNARALGYREEEISQLLELLVKRDIIEFYQHHRIREVPSQTVDLDAVAHRLTAYKQDLDALKDGYADNARFQQLLGEANRFQTMLEAQRTTQMPDPQTVHRLGRAVQARHEELRMFATDKQAELANQLRSLVGRPRPLNPREVEVLNQPVNASVGYVEQVNVLRNHLRNSATEVKSRTDRAKSQAEEALRIVSQEGLSYENLARQVGELGNLERQIDSANSKLAELEDHLRQFDRWHQLVALGSELLENLGQMGDKVQEQREEFEGLSRDIRADISSQANKLDALPRHTMYAAPMRELQEQVRQIRRQLEDEFHNLQKRYFHAFVERGFVTREQVGSPFEFNPASVESSYRLVYDHARGLTQRICEQLAVKANDERQHVLNLLYSEALTTLHEEDREQIQSEGNQLAAHAQELGEHARELREISASDDILQDFPSPDSGRFSQLLAELVEIKASLAQINTSARVLDRRLSEISLTADEAQFLQLLPTEALDNVIDIIDWRQCVDIPPDDFWRLVRALYDKRRIRLGVGRIRE